MTCAGAGVNDLVDGFGTARREAVYEGRVRPVPILAASLLAISCAPPNEQRAPSRHERLIAWLQEEGPEGRPAHPCERRGLIGDSQYVTSDRPRHCLDLGPARVMRGIWFTGMEESGLIPDARAVNLRREMNRDGVGREFDTFLDIDEEEAWSRLGGPRPVGTLAVAITFVGRRARPVERDDGIYDETVVVDAVLSGRVLGRVTRRDCLGNGPCSDIP